MRSSSASAWPQFYRLRIGDPLTVISPQGAATAFGTVPRVRAYKVVAVFDAGLNDYNNSVVFMPLPAAQVFFQKPDAITGIEIRVADPDNVDALLPPLRQVLDGRKVLAARLAACQRHHHRRAAGAEGHHVHRARHDRAGGGVQRGLVADHDGEGQDAPTSPCCAPSAPDSFAVLRIFLMCGAFVGVTGTLIGTVIGMVFCRNIVAIQHAVEDITGGRVFDSSVFMLTALPNTIDWGDVARVVVARAGAVAAGDAVSKLARRAHRSGGSAAA